MGRRESRSVVTQRIAHRHTTSRRGKESRRKNVSSRISVARRAGFSAISFLASDSGEAVKEMGTGLLREKRNRIAASLRRLRPGP